MLLVVVNGAAGSGRGAKIWRLVETELVRRGVRFEAVHAADGLGAREAAGARIRAGLNGESEAVQAAAVIGGDGSVNALLPLFAGTAIPLGVIPAGSGNDTARALGVSGTAIDALERILAGETQAIDLIRLKADSTDGVMKPSAFVLTAVASGFDADVALAVNRARYKRWCNLLGIGSLAYIVGVLDRLRSYRPVPVTIRVDGTVHSFERCWMAAVANVPGYGGGLRICPEADPSDGLLDICVVHSCTPWQLLRLFPTLLAGTHVKLPYVTMLRGDRIAVEAGTTGLPGRLPVVGDGEPASAAIRFEAEAAPGRLLVFKSSDRSPLRRHGHPGR